LIELEKGCLLENVVIYWWVVDDILSLRNF